MERLKRVLKRRFPEEEQSSDRTASSQSCQAAVGGAGARTCAVQGAPEGDWGGLGLCLRKQAGAPHWDGGSRYLGIPSSYLDPMIIYDLS